MLFRILKLFGIDVPARMASMRAEVERRVETAKEEFTRAARMAAVVAALSALAAVAVLGAAAVGLVALYSWVADNYGHFYGLAAVGGLLVIVAVILLVTAMVEARSWERDRTGDPKPPRVQPAMVAAEGVPPAAVAVESAGAELSPPVHTPTATADLVAPLSLILSRVMKFPSTGNAILDTLVSHLRDSAKGVADDAIDSVARTVRYGDRSQVFAVLGTAVLVGWVMAKNRPEHINFN
jgi:MFS family permease